MKIMSTDNTKAVKELLEIINNKVGKMEMRQSLQTTQFSLIKDQQSVMNEKLDGLKDEIKEVKKNVKEMSENVDAARGDIEQLHMDVKGIRDDEIKTHLRMPLISDIPEV